MIRGAKEFELLDCIALRGFSIFNKHYNHS